MTQTYYDQDGVPMRDLRIVDRDDRLEVSALLGETLKKSGQERWEVAGRLATITRVPITPRHLNEWAAPSNENRNLPAWLIPALETTCNTHALTEWACGKGGGRCLWGAEATLAMLGSLERRRDRLDGQIADLKTRMKKSGM